MVIAGVEPGLLDCKQKYNPSATLPPFSIKTLPILLLHFAKCCFLSLHTARQHAYMCVCASACACVCVSEREKEREACLIFVRKNDGYFNTKARFVLTDIHAYLSLSHTHTLTQTRAHTHTHTHKSSSFLI